MKFFEFKLTNNTFFKNVTTLLSANVIIQILAFVLSPIITRLYSPEDFGHLAIFMSIAGFFIVLSSLRFDLAFILPKKDDDAFSLLSLSFLISIIVAFTSFLFIYFFHDNINNYYKIDFSENWIFILPFLIFFTSLFNILINFHNRFNKYKQQATAISILGLSNPLSAISFGFFNLFSFGLIKAILLGNILGSFYLLFSLFKHNLLKLRSNFSNVFYKYIEFPLYNMPHALLNFVSESLPVLLLTPVFGDLTIGLFTMAIGKVFKPINMLGNSIYQVLSKKMVDSLHQKKTNSKSINKLIGLMILIAIIPFVILFLYAPQIFSFIWGKEWMQAGIYLRYLLPWLFMTYLTGTLSFIPNIYKEQKIALVLEFVHLILRYTALSIGIYYNDVNIALILFSAVGFIMLSISLFWFVSIVKKNDSKFMNY